MAGKYIAHHPELPNRPGVNWVERKGGLPKPINAIKRALVAKGWSEQRAIATAVNHVRKTCATGRAFGGKVEVSPEARAVACRAAAEWEALKVSASIPSDQAMVVELAATPNTATRRKLAREGKAIPGGGPGGRFPIRDRGDLRKAILAYGRAKPEDRAKVRAHIIRRARALGAADMIPSSWT